MGTPTRPALLLPERFALFVLSVTSVLIMHFTRRKD